MPLLALVVALAGVASVSADHETDPVLDHIIVDTPTTYAQCIDEVTSDTISITNVKDPTSGADWYLQGQVIVQYETDSGRVIVPGGFYPVAQYGDLELEVFYPPVSEWPVQSNGTAEIHVDIQIEVYNVQGGIKLGELGIGPGHDWDVFCLTPPDDDPGLEGCTPGFWKVPVHSSAWDATGYSQSQTVEDVFDVPDAYGLDDDTLLDALWYGGGPGEVGAAQILLRAAVASLLNAGHPDIDFPQTETEIIAAVNAALNSGDRGAMIDLAGALDDSNNLGCPIDD